jgi:hypothetical protein
LDRFGDYEPVFLAQKVIHIKHKPKVWQSNRQTLKIDLKSLAKQAIKSTSRRSVVYIAAAPAIGVATVAAESNHSSKINTNRLSLNTGSNRDSIWDRLRQINAINPLDMLRPISLNDSQINRIYLLTYFRSGSSFLGKCLMTKFRLALDQLLIFDVALNTLDIHSPVS